MCLAVPGEIVAISENPGPTPVARVSFDGIVRTVQLALVPEARVGDHVLCHVGCAISVIKASHAAEIWTALTSQVKGSPETETKLQEEGAE